MSSHSDMKKYKKFPPDVKLDWILITLVCLGFWFAVYLLIRSFV